MFIFHVTLRHGALNVEGITEFVDAGGNVLVAGSSLTGDVLREIARYYT